MTKTILSSFLSILIVSVLLACTDSNAGQLSVNELHQRMEEGNAPVILDVRSDKEFKAGHLKGAIHIPLKQIKQRFAELETYKGKEMVVYCHSGGRAKKAAGLLNDAGFNHVVDLTGHYEAWKKAGLPINKIN